jgi:hypothetical protein
MFRIVTAPLMPPRRKKHTRAAVPSNKKTGFTDNAVDTWRAMSTY